MEKTKNASFSEGLAIDTKDDPPQTKFGAIDKSGKVVIPFEFDALGPFFNGLAPAARKKAR